MKNSLFILYLWVMTFNVFAQSRIEVEFNDQWQFKKGPFASENYISIASSQDEEWDNVTIPHTWNADDMQEKKNDFYAGDGLYRKKFTPSEESKDKRTYLRFEGVGAVAQMYVNGKFAGRHLGGYSAFCFEITSLLKYGEENEIVLRANNASRDDIIPTNHNLFGVYGGIYRPVWLIVTDSINISPLDHASSGVYVSQKSVTSKSAQIEVKVALDNGGLKPIDVELENIIYDMEGKKVLSNRSPINLSSQGLQLNVTDFNIKKPHLWNGRKDPYLYSLNSTCKCN
ncbi:MAG: beta galactosidase jelly roll domain-containing protein [Rikenellaceae bacterium]